jgi:hypothetical protein
MRETLEKYLDECGFRDYKIADRKHWCNPKSKISRTLAVHQIVDEVSLQSDVDNAINQFCRDGFPRIVFYIGEAMPSNVIQFRRRA